MSEPIPANATWGYDSIDHYRLTVNIINGYLQKKWGRYNFYVEVSREASNQLCGHVMAYSQPLV